MRLVSVYSDVPISLAGVLLLAAGLEGYQLATDRVLGTGLLESRWFQVPVVEFEVFFGLWLLVGILLKLTWAVALVCFGLFTCVWLPKALSGKTSCGCFGRVPANRWYTVALDAAAVLALLRWHPKGGLPRTPHGKDGPGPFALRGTITLLVWLLVGVPAAAAMGTSQLAILAEESIILGDDNLELGDPRARKMDRQGVPTATVHQIRSRSSMTERTAPTRASCRRQLDPRALSPRLPGMPGGDTEIRTNCSAIGCRPKHAPTDTHRVAPVRRNGLFETPVQRPMCARSAE